MVVRLRGWLPWSAGLLLAAAGCKSASQPQTVAVAPPHPADWKHYSPGYRNAPRLVPPATPAKAAQEGIELVSYRQPVEQAPEKPPETTRPRIGERLQLPADLPGSNAPVITLPEDREQRKLAIDKAFPPLSPLPAVPTPGGTPLSLADLQRMALASNPVIRQATASADAARGAATQAGLCPNPRVGYQGDTIHQGDTAGTHGVFAEQTIKTGHKLQLAQSAAQVEVENAELTRRRAEFDLMTQVRKGYFAVLAARRAMTVSRALAALTTEVYTIQVTRLRLGQAAVYEPLQARVMANQTHAAFVQAQNRYASAWRQLAAALGQRDLAPGALAGDLDQPVPRFDHASALARVLSQHTDVLTAENELSRAQIIARLAEATPVPDVDLRYMAQKDYTAQPNNVVHSVAVGFQLPLWNRNQGGIHEAHSRLNRAGDEQHRVRNELSAQLASAFEKYENSRALVLLYRDQMVPDQVTAYRAVYRRYDTEAEVLNFNDVMAAQQTLTDTIKTYIEALGGLWEATADLANLLQVEDLFAEGATGPTPHDLCPVPPLEPVPQPRGCELKLSSSAQQAPAAEAAPPQAPASTPRRVRFRVIEKNGGQQKVPFDVLRLESLHRVGFKVRPVEAEAPEREGEAGHDETVAPDVKVPPPSARRSGSLPDETRPEVPL